MVEWRGLQGSYRHDVPGWWDEALSVLPLNASFGASALSGLSVAPHTSRRDWEGEMGANVETIAQVTIAFCVLSVLFIIACGVSAYESWGG
jgi:hypothetical protein